METAGKAMFAPMEWVIEELKEIREAQNEIRAILINGPTIKKKYLTLTEVVDEFDFSKAFIYQKTASNEIPCLRPGGGKLLFKREDLEAWIESNGKPGKVRKLNVVK